MSEGGPGLSDPCLGGGGRGRATGGGGGRSVNGGSGSALGGGIGGGVLSIRLSQHKVPSSQPEP